MGFFKTLREKLSGKKAEPAPLPTVDSIQQENADLTKKEEQVAQTITEAPVQATPSTDDKTVIESIGPEPESVAIPATAPKKSSKKKAAKKKAVKKVAKKTVKKASKKPAKKAGKKKKK